MSINPNAGKAALRKQLLDLRKQLTGFEKAQRDQQLCVHLANWFEQYLAQRSRCRKPKREIPHIIGVYWPVFGEPDLRGLYQDLVKRGCQLALPEASADLPLLFRLWQPGTPMLQDSYGIPIPAQAVYVMPQILLIPCVGFGEQGYRLGYGGGFYDRTLAAYAPRELVTIGVAYAFSNIPNIPLEPHDRPLNQICSDAGWQVFT